MTNAEIIAVVQAAETGKPIQYRNPVLCDLPENWNDVEKPAWNFDCFVYRVKPAPPAKKRVPLTASDIPPVCWVSVKGDAVQLVIAVSDCEVSISFEWVSFYALATNGSRYSSDLKTWLPCWKEVEA